MKIELLKSLIASGPIDVEFTSEIAEFDTCIEPGFQGTIVFMSDPDDYRVAFLIVDLSKFEERNKAFMKSNWYDENGVACLNSYEVGMYPKDNRVTLYLDVDFSLCEFVLLNEQKKALTSKFIEAKEAGFAGNYVAWLEDITKDALFL